ncbi:MAG TPA: Ig-like domain-containing protein [Gemmatimonadaceae bacterium]|nr:Ig-like domain-containing protein [Gemmatimonadaceae bacterium]
MVLSRANARAFVLAAILVGSLAACEDPFSVRVGPPAALRHAGGNGQSDTVGAVLSESLAVRVIDAAGNPVEGVTVFWGHGATAGIVEPPTSVTDTLGIARTSWQLGRVPGGQIATATVNGVEPLAFGATALAVVRPGPLTWALVHRGLPAPGARAIGIAGAHASDVFVAVESGRVFWFDGFGWSELISNAPPGPLDAMWGPSSVAIFATGTTPAGDAGFVASFVGQHWTNRYARAGGRFHALHGRGPEDLWAVGSEIVHYDGATWMPIPVPGATARAVWAVAPGVAFVGDDGGAIHRVDTAATQLGNPLGVGIRALYGFSPDEVYAGDAAGTVLRWNGAQWSIAAQFGPEPIVAMGGTGPDDLWVVGGVYAHFDGGAWRVLDPDDALPTGTVGVWASAPGNVWAVTDSVRLKLFDGAAWREHWDSPVAFEGIWGSSASDLHVCGGQGTVQRFDGNHWSTERLAGWQACRSVHGSAATFALASTRGPLAYRFDGGGWERSATGAPLGGALWVHASGVAMAPGPAGAVLRYDGTDWSPLSTGSPAVLHAVWGNTPSDVWAGGTGGTLLHYDGVGWTPVASGATGTIRRLWGVGADLWAVADDGSSGSVVLRAGGAQWSTVHASAERLLALHGRTAADVFAAGAGGTMLRWDGQQWRAEATGLTDTLTDVWASPDGDVFAVGARGVILRGRR